MATATLITENLDGWAPGTRHYQCSDGKYLAVEAMPIPEETTQIIRQGEAPLVDSLLATLGESFAALKLVVRPTVVFLCSEGGVPVDADENDHDPLTPLHTFDAGTTHEDALMAAGYTIV